MYEFDIVECLMRLRWGRILALTEKELGQEVSYDVPSMELTMQALAIVRLVFLFGKLTMEEIADSMAEHELPASALRKVVVQMLRRGFLEPTCAELMMLRSDQIDRRYRVSTPEFLGKIRKSLMADQMDRQVRRSGHETAYAGDTAGAETQRDR